MQPPDQSDLNNVFQLHTQQAACQYAKWIEDGIQA